VKKDSRGNKGGVTRIGIVWRGLKREQPWRRDSCRGEPGKAEVEVGEGLGRARVVAAGPGSPCWSAAKAILLPSEPKPAAKSSKLHFLAGRTAAASACEVPAILPIHAVWCQRTVTTRTATLIVSRFEPRAAVPRTNLSRCLLWLVRHRVCTLAVLGFCPVCQQPGVLGCLALGEAAKRHVAAPPRRRHRVCGPC